MVGNYQIIIIKTSAKMEVHHKVVEIIVHIAEENNPFIAEGTQLIMVAEAMMPTYWFKLLEAFRPITTAFNSVIIVIIMPMEYDFMLHEQAFKVEERSLHLLLLYLQL